MPVLLFMVVEALILLAVWRWDDRKRRAELRRRRLKLLQTRSNPH
jgi:hypothetical protein